MKKIISILGILIMLAVPAFASGPTDFDSDSVRDTVFNDVYILDSLYVVDDLFVTGNVSGEQRVSIPLAGVTTNGAPIGADGTTAPGMATTDGIPAIVWADDEVTPIEFSFRIAPGMEGSGWAIRLLATTSDVATPPEVDWQLFFQSDDSDVDSTADGQTAVSYAGEYSNEEVTLTPDATAQTASTAGTTVTVNIWPTTTGSGTYELKNIEIYKP